MVVLGCEIEKGKEGSVMEEGEEIRRMVVFSLHADKAQKTKE